MNTAELTPAGELTAEELGTIHLIGIGGVGMSGLARLMLTRGVPVSGSELREWPALAALRALGGTVHMNHEPSNLDGVDTVVYSSAIPQDHVEMVEARRRGLRLLHRSEALAAAMTDRQTIAVPAPTARPPPLDHDGDLQHAGQDPSFVIGGEISEAGSNGHHGTGPHSWPRPTSTTSVPDLPPHVANHHQLEGDHLNNWGDLEGSRRDS